VGEIHPGGAISARTALCGIVLHPAGHTRSPAMHNAAFADRAIDAVYVSLDVRPESLPAALAGARALGIRQLAISIPHKQAVIAHLDEVEPLAAEIGAVNTVTLRDGRLVGSNTDWIGATRALERETAIEGRRAVVLGAGGAAPAVVWGLQRQGARVTILNRTPARARELADALGADGCGALTDLAATPHEILVNTTSVGLRDDASPVSADAIAPQSVVLDAVYDPEETRLLRDAQSRGARTVSGKWMLVYQAAAQFEAWTGVDAPVDVMAQAFESAAPGPTVRGSNLGSSS